MNFLKSGLAASSVTLALSGAAAAAPVTYDIDQAFWGQYLVSVHGAIGTEQWQANRQAAVDANPSAFEYVRGSVTLDWDTGSVSDVGVTVDYMNGATQITYTQADYAGAPHFPVYGTGVDQVVLNFQRAYGPTLNFVSYVSGSQNSMPQYLANFQLVVTHFPTNGDVALVLQSATLGEARQTHVYNPYIGSMEAGGAYFNLDTNATTKTYGGYGIAESAPAVPLPAPALLLIGGLGAMAAFRRRKG